MHLKPKPGFLVRDPFSREPLPEGGAEKPDIPYWRRRAATGDVEIIKPDEVARPEPEPESKPAPAPRKPKRDARAED